VATNLPPIAPCVGCGVPTPGKGTGAYNYLVYRCDPAHPESGVLQIFFGVNKDTKEPVHFIVRTSGPMGTIPAVPVVKTTFEGTLQPGEHKVVNVPHPSGEIQKVVVVGYSLTNVNKVYTKRDEWKECACETTSTTTPSTTPATSTPSTTSVVTSTSPTTSPSRSGSTSTPTTVSDSVPLVSVVPKGTLPQTGNGSTTDAVIPSGLATLAVGGALLLAAMTGRRRRNSN
jgi:hypothetical protein